MQSVIRLLPDCGLLTCAAQDLSEHRQWRCWNLSVDGTFIALGSVFVCLFVFYLWVVRGATGPQETQDTQSLHLAEPFPLPSSLSTHFPLALPVTLSSGFPSLPTLLLCLPTAHPFLLCASQVLDSPI